MSGAPSLKTSDELLYNSPAPLAKHSSWQWRNFSVVKQLEQPVYEWYNLSEVSLWWKKKLVLRGKSFFYTFAKWDKILQIIWSVANSKRIRETWFSNSFVRKTEPILWPKLFLRTVVWKVFTQTKAGCCLVGNPKKHKSRWLPTTNSNLINKIPQWYWLTESFIQNSGKEFQCWLLCFQLVFLSVYKYQISLFQVQYLLKICLIWVEKKSCVASGEVH